MLTDGIDGALFKPAHLRLRNTDFRGDLHLRFPLVKAQGENVPLPGCELLQRVFQGDPLRPALIGILCVAEPDP